MQGLVRRWADVGVRLRLAPVAFVLTVVTLAMALQVEPAGAASPGSRTCNTAVTPGHFSCFSIVAKPTSNAAYPETLSPSPYRPAASTHAGYGPADLAAAYALPTSSSTTTIAIVDAYDDPAAEADLAVYRNFYKLPPCTTANGCFRKVNQKGQASPLPAVDQGWAGEISLDLDMVSATCPSCHILLVEANQASTDLYLAVQAAVALGAKYVSMSWGGPELSAETTIDRAVFNAPGVAYVAASGDNGYGVSYPAASAKVVAVGGTTLRQAGGPRGWSESVWRSSASVGAGSGCSAYVPKPSWQSVVPNSLCAKRAVADVSAVADPATGVAVYQSFGLKGWLVYGGTSAAAPIIASVYALAGTPAASDNPASFPYTYSGALNDVAVGTNGQCGGSALCTAGPGWDGPSGLGTPNGVGAFRASGPSAGSTPTPNGPKLVTLTNPGAQSSVISSPVQLQISAHDSAPATALAYTASNLPRGLSLNRVSGLISGRATALASYPVTVTVTDATGAWASTSFYWKISQSPAVCRGQLLSNGGFQSGSGGWAASKGVIRSNSQLARSGRTNAQLGGTGQSQIQTLSRTITVPPGCVATLSYQLKVASPDTSRAARDTLTVLVQGRATQRFSNLNRGGYAKRAVRLSTAGSGRIQIRWVSRENRGKATAFMIDDVSVTLSLK